MTARQLIYSALRWIGALRPGQGASDEAYEDGLTTLNGMLEMWSIERMMIYSTSFQSFDIVDNQQSYTIGTGGDWDIPRPPKVDRASVVMTTGSYPVEIPLTVLQYTDWQLVRVKTIPSTIPQMVYFDEGFPLNRAYLYPIPNGGQPIQIKLYYWALLERFADLDTNYEFPPGYDLALRFNLGELLWPAFVVMTKTGANGMQLQMVQQMARNAKNTIKSFNYSPPNMRVDRALRQQRNWFDLRTNGGIS